MMPLLTDRLPPRPAPTPMSASAPHLHRRRAVPQPERLSGHDYKIQSDVWSTGITLLELVTNRFPFPTDLAAIELMMYITQNEVWIHRHTALCY